MSIRFGLVVDDDNGAHVRFRLFAANGGQHLAGCGGQMVMQPAEFAAFRELLEPMLTDRSDPPATDTAEIRCVWCHKAGHTADEHPLPKDHPQYDAFYDASDDELGEVASQALRSTRG